jgi:hypothetical protein
MRKALVASRVKSSELRKERSKEDERVKDTGFAGSNDEPCSWKQKFRFLDEICVLYIRRDPLQWTRRRSSLPEFNCRPDPWSERRDG